MLALVQNKIVKKIIGNILIMQFLAWGIYFFREILISLAKKGTVTIFFSFDDFL